MEWYWYIFIVAAIGLVVYGVHWFVQSQALKKIHQDLTNLGIPKHVSRLKYKQISPMGVRFFSTVKLPVDAMLLVEDGIENQIERHNERFPQWRRYHLLTDYDVIFIDPMATNVETEPGSPALLVKGYQAAGTCIGLDGLPAVDRPHIVLPHQENQEWRFRDYLMRSAWHESEHVREWENDIEVYARFIGAGDVHPHIP